MTKQEKIIDSFLALKTIKAEEYVKVEKNKYEFHIPISADTFKVYKLNYKHHTYEGYDLYFEHFSKNNFQCTLNKIKN